MATTTHDRTQPHQVQVHTINQPHHGIHSGGGDKTLGFPQHHHQQGGGGGGPSTNKVLAVMALLPIGGILLGLAGITLVGTLIGLAIATPVFIIFSPIIVPAILTIGLAVAGFLTSGTFGLTGLSSLSFLLNSLRQVTGTVPEQMDYAKRRVVDLVEYTGQKTKEAGQAMQDKAHEIGPEGQVHGGGGVGVGVGGGGVKEGGQVHAGGKEGRGARSTS